MMLTDYRKWLSLAQWEERSGQPPIRPGRTFRPRLETLEERTLLNAGSLDPTFGTGGVAFGPPISSPWLPAFAVQPDGQLLVASYAGPGLQVVRENANGTSSTIIASLPEPGDFVPDGLAVQPDGKILVGFHVGTNYSGVLRLDSDGAVDTSFGYDGALSAPLICAGPGGMVVQSDGKIVLMGDANWQPAGYNHDHPGGPIVLMRYDANGQLDPTFGTDGVVLTPFTYGNLVLAVSPDDKLILSGGQIWTDPVLLPTGPGGELLPSWTVYNAVLRYDADGAPDSTFGNDGVASTTVNGIGFSASDAIAQLDGGVVLLGYLQNGQNGEEGLIRLTSDGAVDSTFGDDGFVGIGAASQVLLEGDGKILVTTNFQVLARYNSDGSVDSTFGDDGQVSTSLGPMGAYEPQMVLAPNGEIDMAAFSYSPDTGSRLIFARFESDAPPMPTVITSATGPSPGVYGAGDTLSYTITYNGPVTVSGTPEIVVDLYTHQGGPFGQNTLQRVEAVYSGGSGTNVLTFTYVVQPSDGGPPTAYDPPSGDTAVSPIQLDGGSITGANGAPVSLDFTAPDSGGVHVYGLAPPSADSSDPASASEAVAPAAGNTNSSPLPVGAPNGPGATLAEQFLARMVLDWTNAPAPNGGNAFVPGLLQNILGGNPFTAPVTGGVGPTPGDPLGTRLLGGDGSDLPAEPWWAALPAAAPVEAVAWTGEEAALLTAEAGAVGDAPVALHDTVFLTPLPAEGERVGLLHSLAAEGDRVIPSPADGGADIEPLYLALALLAARLSLTAPPRQGQPVVKASPAGRRIQHG